MTQHIRLQDDTIDPRAFKELHDILRQVKKIFKINRHQTRQAVIFDTMEAIDRATQLLTKAWKVGRTYGVENEFMNQQFIEMYKMFQQMKEDMSAATGEYKH